MSGTSIYLEVPEQQQGSRAFEVAHKQVTVFVPLQWTALGDDWRKAVEDETAIVMRIARQNRAAIHRMAQEKWGV